MSVKTAAVNVLQEIQTTQYKTARQFPRPPQPRSPPQLGPPHRPLPEVPSPPPPEVPSQPLPEVPSLQRQRALPAQL